MDVDDLLDPNELPEASVDVDRALATTLRRGRSRRRRIAGSALLAAAVLLGGAATLAVRDTADDALRVTTDPPTSTSSVPSTPEPEPVVVPRECADPSGGEVGVASEPDWRRHADYVPWTNRDGCLVRIDVVAERPGPAHCGWEEAQVLILGRPLGTRYTTPDDTDEYVRDPEGVFGQPDLTEGFSADATLPGRAVDSGYRSSGRSLWYDPDDASAVWLVSPDDVERWPAGEPPICM